MCSNNSSAQECAISEVLSLPDELPLHELSDKKSSRQQETR